MIRLQTSKRRDILNVQAFEISAFERNWAEDLPRQFGGAIFRTGLSPLYNCHGLTFSSRRTRITEPDSIIQILTDDKYEEINVNDSLPGDVILYYSDDGDPTHSGIIVENEPPLHVPKVYSKWGSGPEVIHYFRDVPSIYGHIYKVFRCRL